MNTCLLENAGIPILYYLLKKGENLDISDLSYNVRQ